MSPIHIERLKTAYAVMAGIPKRQVKLETWNTSGVIEPGCNTIACTGGWCALYPEFNAQGLYADALGWPKVDHLDAGPESLGHFFGLDDLDVRRVFGSARPFEPDHRRVALARIRHVLFRERAITPERDRELAAQEEAL